MNKNWKENLAEKLWQARIRAKPCSPLTETNPELTIADAYVISELNFKKRLTQTAVKSIGKKIGLTSHAVQKQLGVDQPDFGNLTSDMLLTSGASVKTNILISPKIEGEVAFVLKKDLQGPNLSSKDVIAATDYIIPCIEIIDSRIANWKIKIQDTIADNASSAFFVIGDQPCDIKCLENLENAKMELHINDILKSEGKGVACLDHPLNAVTWLANALSQYNVSLRAGEIILSGAFGPVVPVIAGDHCTVRIETLGTVSCAFV